jgi:hypothetical protein
METIEIASYPKSGNTWFRRIVEDFLFETTGEKILPGDIHQEGKEVLSEKKCFSLPNIEGEYVVYKSHIPNNPKIKPNKIIHIQRHPLDVFLSAINYLYLQTLSGKIVKERLETLFVNGNPKKVDDIYHDGELDYYFQDFLCNAGSKYWPGMLQDRSNYFEYQRQVSLLNNCLSIKYEDLISHFDSTVEKSLAYMFGDTGKLAKVSAARVDAKTKNSGSGFFWKAKFGNYKDYLSEEQINEFYSKYRNEMNFLGYA